MNIDVKKYYDIAYTKMTPSIKFKYVEFIDGWHECEAPENPKYRAGDVLVIEDDGEIVVGAVVLGVISHKTEELRTDTCGMICFDQIIRHATLEDIHSMSDKTRYKKIISDLLQEKKKSVAMVTLREHASLLIMDGENEEYTRGICELLAQFDTPEDMDIADRAEEIRNELV